MEQAASPDIQTREVQDKDRLRTAQRQKILYDHFKNPSKLELFTGLIPSDRPSPNTAVDEAGLRHLAEALGKNTHTVLFDLAATSKNPMELYNTILNISNLRKVESSYWKFEDSEDLFLKRRLPEYVDVSEEAKDQAEAMSSDSQHLLESFFYTISTENVSIEDKRLTLRDFYAVKTLLPPASGNVASQKIYGPASSFWSHVDGSWIDPKLAPKEHTERSKKAIIASSIASGLRDRLKRPEAMPQNTTPASRAESAQPEDLGQLMVDRFVEARARERATTPRTESPATPEAHRFPPGSTAEDLGVPSDTDLSSVGLLTSTGHIKGLRPFALITLKDGTQRRVGFNPYSFTGKILLDDDSTVGSDQIERFRNQDPKTYKYDTTRDILVRNEPAPKPREVVPTPASDTTSDRTKVLPPTAAPETPLYPSHETAALTPSPDASTRRSMIIEGTVSPKPKPPEVKPLPHNVTAEMLGLENDYDLSLAGKRDELGYVFGLRYGAIISLKDGSQPTFISRSPMDERIVIVDDGSEMSADQIVSFRNLGPNLSRLDPKAYDNSIDIPVWNWGEKQPREPTPSPSPDAPRRWPTIFRGQVVPQKPPEGATAARAELPIVPETNGLPPNVTAEMLGLSPDFSYPKDAGERLPSGNIYGLRSDAIITLWDGTEHKIKYANDRSAFLVEGGNVDVSLIKSFYNANSDINIIVWAPKPRPQDTIPTGQPARETVALDLNVDQPDVRNDQPEGLKALPINELTRMHVDLSTRIDDLRNNPKKTLGITRRKATIREYDKLQDELRQIRNETERRPIKERLEAAEQLALRNPEISAGYLSFVFRIPNHDAIEIIQTQRQERLAPDKDAILANTQPEDLTKLSDDRLRFILEVLESKYRLMTGREEEANRFGRSIAEAERILDARRKLHEQRIQIVREEEVKSRKRSTLLIRASDRLTIRGRLREYRYNMLLENAEKLASGNPDISVSQLQQKYRISEPEAGLLFEDLQKKGLVAYGPDVPVST